MSDHEIADLLELVNLAETVALTEMGIAAAEVAERVERIAQP